MTETADLPSAPDDVVADDHLLAAWAATLAGERLERLRSSGREGKDLKDAGDALGHKILMHLLTTCCPDDAVLSEEVLSARRGSLRGLCAGSCVRPRWLSRTGSQRL